MSFNFLVGQIFVDFVRFLILDIRISTFCDRNFENEANNIHEESKNFPFPKQLATIIMGYLSYICTYYLISLGWWKESYFLV